MTREYYVGQPVVFGSSKNRVRAGPQASNASPAERDDAACEVDQFWLVDEVCDDGTLVLRTRRGQQHVVEENDSRLRPASWWERIRYRKRFPEPMVA